MFGKNYKTKDGTCVRDYIHVMDLADGHISILKNKDKKCGFKVFNFGTGKGSTVLEVIQAFKKQTGKEVPYKFTGRRNGDVSATICSPKKALKELNDENSKKLVKNFITENLQGLKKIVEKQ